MIKLLMKIGTDAMMILIRNADWYLLFRNFNNGGNLKIGVIWALFQGCVAGFLLPVLMPDNDSCLASDLVVLL